MKNYFLIALLFSVFLLPYDSFGAPAYPGIIKFKQPDGETLSIRLFGDEHFHWAETIDGYTLLFNEAGFYEYAVKNAQGDLTGSGIIAKDVPVRPAGDVRFLSGIKKKLSYSPDQTSMLKQIRQIYSIERQRVFPTSGNRKLICILIGYTDLAFTKTQSDFNALFNQVGYSVDSATGSVKDYYLENSWDQLTLDVTVAGPYTAANPMAYYGANDPDGWDLLPQELVAEAVDLADPDLNYADFDNDADGTVDSVYVIYAGFGEEAGASTDAIWAHAWGIDPVTLDGKSISRYSCSSELRGNSGTDITRIGVICHEFGHVLGAPDYYDTDYETGGQYSGTGSWDLMAGGSWNNDGATPAHHNGFTKWYYYNWFSVSVLTTDQVVTVQNIESNQTAYYFNSPSTNEYWLLENRQQIGFDAALPGHGLIIYHVDQDQLVVHSNNNDINATHPQYMYPVCASASMNPSATLSSYGSINSAGCPFPGSSNTTEFSGTTTPAAIDWAGNPSDKVLDSIQENSGVITFNFARNLEPGAFTADQSSSGQIDLIWTLNNQNHDVLLAWSPDGSFGLPANGTVYAPGNSIPGGGTVLYYGPDTSFSHTGINEANAYYYKAWSYSGSTYSNGVTTDYIPTLYTFDFETGGLPVGWTETHGAATDGWSVGTDGSSDYWYIPSHTNYAYVNDDACDCDMSDVWLISSPLDLSAVNSAMMEFDSFAKNEGYGGIFTLKASTNGGASWADIATITESGDWTMESIDMSLLTGHSNVKIAFHYNDENDWGYGWAVDNIVITGEGDGPSDDGPAIVLPAINLLLLGN